MPVRSAQRLAVPAETGETAGPTPRAHTRDNSRWLPPATPWGHRRQLPKGVSAQDGRPPRAIASSLRSPPAGRGLALPAFAPACRSPPALAPPHWLLSMEAAVRSPAVPPPPD